jgi:hypothetical protein
MYFIVIIHLPLDSARAVATNFQVLSHITCKHDAYEYSIILFSDMQICMCIATEYNKCTHAIPVHTVQNINVSLDLPFS